jgi:hypothetical protein
VVVVVVVIAAFTLNYRSTDLFNSWKYFSMFFPEYWSPERRGLMMIITMFNNEYTYTFTYYEVFQHAQLRQKQNLVGQWVRYTGSWRHHKLESILLVSNTQPKFQRADQQIKK